MIWSDIESKATATMREHNIVERHRKFTTVSTHKPLQWSAWLHPEEHVSPALQTAMNCEIANLNYNIQISNRKEVYNIQIK